MPENGAKLTVFFQEPFWVGLYERWTEGLLQVCKITFGAEPKDYQVYEFLLNHWDGLRFSPPVAEEKEEDPRKNPKRVQREIQRQLAGLPTSTRSQQALSLQREAAKATQPKGLGTKAQEALARQREAVGLERQARRAAQKRRTQEERFRLRQEKKREKRRGPYARAALFYKIRLHRPAPEQTLQRWPAEPERTARNQR